MTRQAPSSRPISEWRSSLRSSTLPRWLSPAAWLTYRYLGLKFVSRSWFNLDAIWGLSLVLVGVIALVFNLLHWH